MLKIGILDCEGSNNMTRPLEYQPGRFAFLHDEFREVWPFLNSPGLVERMKILSRRGVPAISALDIEAIPVWNALNAARPIGAEDQLKQMIGHQVRQIMEAEGYRKTGGKQIRNSWIFTWGSVYQHPEWRKLYVHKNREYAHSDAFCVAAKRKLPALRNPPPDIFTWIPYRMCHTKKELNFVLQGNLEDDFGVSWRELCDTVSEEGYCVLTYLEYVRRRNRNRSWRKYRS